MQLADNLNFLLALATLIGQVVVIVWLCMLLVNRGNALVRFFGQRATLWAFLVTLGATLGSLTYSQIVHYTPCDLCWFQRIFIYPQVILYGIDLIKKRRTALGYGLWLSIIGMCISAYQYLMQFGVVPEGSCAAAGQVSCAARVVFEFHFITIPLMAFTAFALVIIFILSDRLNASL